MLYQLTTILEATDKRRYPEVAGALRMTPKPTNRIDRLKHAHRKIDTHVQLLAERAWLLPREQLDLRILKKRRLRIRDRIAALTAA